jgi:hypothetical protein
MSNESHSQDGSNSDFQLIFTNKPRPSSGLSHTHRHPERISHRPEPSGDPFEPVDQSSNEQHSDGVVPLLSPQSLTRNPPDPNIVRPLSADPPPTVPMRILVTVGHDVPLNPEILAGATGRVGRFHFTRQIGRRSEE